MISVEEATELIQSHLYQPKIVVKDLNQSSGHYLAEDIRADRDFPPFNRVAMDGIAIKAALFEAGRREFTIEGIQYAGAECLILKDPTACMEVMTGAMLPMGTDSVIRFEDIEIKDSKATITIDQLKQHQNVHGRATDAAKGDLLIEKNTLITTAEIGVLATVGKSRIEVYEMPKVAIVSTGDELVKVSEQPKEYQIRRSNSHVLKGALSDMKVLGNIYHIADNEENMRHELSGILESYDVLILTGGVSKGKKDFVPAILDDLAVEKLFHRVAQKPGKPFWFGKNNTTTVFALPGNPVSTYLCFNKYIKPWFKSSMGAVPKPLSAILDRDITFKAPLTYFAQVKLTYRLGHLIAEPVLGKGSGDLANLLQADGFLELPPAETEFKKGSSYELILYRSI